MKYLTLELLVELIKMLMNSCVSQVVTISTPNDQSESSVPLLYHTQHKTAKGPEGSEVG